MTKAAYHMSTPQKSCRNNSVQCTLSLNTSGFARMLAWGKTASEQHCVSTVHGSTCKVGRVGRRSTLTLSSYVNPKSSVLTYVAVAHTATNSSTAALLWSNDCHQYLTADAPLAIGAITACTVYQASVPAFVICCAVSTTTVSFGKQKRQTSCSTHPCHILFRTAAAVQANTPPAI